MVQIKRENANRNDISTRSAMVRAETGNEDDMTIECVLSTETPVRMIDWYEWVEMDEILLASGRAQLAHVVMLDSHNRSSISDVLGHLDQIRTEGTDTVVRCNFAKGDPAAESAYRKYKNKHCRAMSVGYSVMKYEDIPAGETRSVEGVEYKARKDRKTRVVTKWRVDEGSLVAIGADKNALTRSECRGASFQIDEDDERLTEFLRSKREQQDATKPAEIKFEAVRGELLTAEPQKVVVEVNVNHIGERTAPEKAVEQETPVVESEETVVTGDQPGGSEISGDSVVESRIASDESDLVAADNGGEKERVKAVAEPTSADQTVGKTAEELAAERKAAIAEGVKLEKERQVGIRKAAAGLDVSEDTIQKCLDDESCSVQDAQLRYLDEIRSKMSKPVEADAPRGVKGANRSERQVGLDVLTGALALRVGSAIGLGDRVADMLPFLERHEDADGNSELRMRRSGEARYTEARKKQHEDAINKAIELERKPQFALCRMALQAAGVNVDVDDTPREIVGRSFSTPTVSTIYTQTVGAVLLANLNDMTDSTLGWTREMRVPNFKDQELHRIEGGSISRRERGEEPKHSKFSDIMEKFRVYEYAEQFKIDRQDLVDDSLNAWSTLGDHYAHVIANLRPALVYGFMAANPNMTEDGLPLFQAASHRNDMTGVALSVDALQQISNRLASMQSAAGLPLNLGDAVLIVPDVLKWDATRILGSAELRNPAAGADYGLTNPVRGLMDMRSDVRLSSGFVYPFDETPVAAAPTQYYVAAKNGMYGLVVGYLQETNGMPYIRTNKLSMGSWGMHMDIQFDIGIGKSDYRGIIRCNP